jgi:hypothetical protein
MSRTAKLIALLVTASAVFTLWPFEFQLPLFSVPNGAKLDQDGALVFESAGIVVDPAGGKMLYERLRDGRAITVAIVADSLSTKQAETGPGRRVSLSTDPHQRNITVGPRTDSLIFRIRTPETGDNGIVPGLRARSAFRPGHKQVLGATYDGERFRLFVDGRLADEQSSQGGLFSDWNPGYPLIFGNEATGDRPWLGRIYDVAVYDTAFDPKRVASLSPASLANQSPDRIYSLTARCLLRASRRATGDEGTLLGNCQIPRLLRVRHSIELFSAKSRDASDYFHGVVVWLPTGFVLGLALRLSSLKIVFLLIGTWATVLESAQMFVPSRSSSLTDLLVTFAAGSAGCLISRHIGRKCSTRLL